VKKCEETLPTIVMGRLPDPCVDDKQGLPYSIEGARTTIPPEAGGMVVLAPVHHSVEGLNLIVVVVYHSSLSVCSTEEQSVNVE
jgi:hypothetical protein